MYKCQCPSRKGKKLWFESTRGQNLKEEVGIESKAKKVRR